MYTNTPLRIAIFTYASLGFLTGTFLHAVFPLEHIALGIPLMALSFLVLFRKITIMIFIITGMIGFVRFDMTIFDEHDGLAPYVGTSVELTGTVHAVRSYDVILDPLTVEGQDVETTSYISFSPHGKWIEEGEKWNVRCRLERNEKSDRSRLLYDARNGVFLRCTGSTQSMRMHAASPWSLRSLLSIYRRALTSRIERLLPGDEGALLAGILYGERGLTKETSDAFRFAGMTHLIAVSGSNISLVVSLFVPFLLFLGYQRRSAIVLAGVGILFFTIFVGAEASVIRAAIMGWLAILARAFGRKADATHLLLVAGTGMVVVDPWALAFDAGFALSFLATWGLIAWTEPLSRIFRFVPNALSLREIVSTTVAATLVTAPYLIAVFGQFSFAGLITNVVAIPLVGFSMLWGAIAITFGDVAPIFVVPAEGCLKLMLLIASLSIRFPFLCVTTSFPLWGLVPSYGGMVVFWLLRIAKKQTFPQDDEFSFEKKGVLNAFVRPV